MEERYDKFTKAYLRAESVKEIFRAELDRLKEETSIGLSEWENGVEHGRMEILNALYKLLDSMQEESATSVWHDANEAPVDTGKFLWVIVSFKDGDIHTCSVSTLVKWQNAQLDAIDCWAYREDLLNIK